MIFFIHRLIVISTVKHLVDICSGYPWAF